MIDDDRLNYWVGLVFIAAMFLSALGFLAFGIAAIIWAV